MKTIHHISPVGKALTGIIVFLLMAFQMKAEEALSHEANQKEEMNPVVCILIFVFIISLAIFTFTYFTRKDKAKELQNSRHNLNRTISKHKHPRRGITGKPV